MSTNATMSNSEVPLNAMECVLQQTMQTYFGVQNKFGRNILLLWRRINNLNVENIGLDRRLLHNDVYQLNSGGDLDPRSATRRRQTPVTYIKVADNHFMTAGVFVLREKAKIPLHDHPFMYGMMKVLYGKVTVQRYSALKPDYCLSKVTNIEVDKLPLLTYGPGDNPCMLDPEIGNIHQVEALDGPAVFFDLLTPPYNVMLPNIGPRRCRFFKEVNNHKLSVVSHHKGYWNDEAPYKGPRITPHAFNIS